MKTKIPYETLQLIREVCDTTFLDLDARVIAQTSRMSGDVVFGVSWASLGAVSVPRAEEFMRQVEFASRVCLMLNEYNFVIDDSMEKQTDSEYYAFKEKLEEVIVKIRIQVAD